MKLYPLLFLNEAAKTTEQAISEGIAAIKLTIWSGSKTIVLFDVKKTTNAFVMQESLQEAENAIMEENGIVGLIDIQKKESDLYKVNASAAILDYGPLAYQIAMQLIGTDKWLMSDYTLAPASKYVWIKMYELSEKGMYTKRFLGDFSNPDHLKNHLGINYDFLEDYEKKYRATHSSGTETDFLSWLAQQNQKSGSNFSPSQFGYLWAYNLSSPINLDPLFKKGKEQIEFLASESSHMRDEILSSIAYTAEQFWQKMYGSEASYSE